MDAERTRANLARLGEPESLMAIGQWAITDALEHRLMCLDCGIRLRGESNKRTCSPCPMAWRFRRRASQKEYWQKPEFELS